jgi:hypothetical protein
VTHGGFERDFGCFFGDFFAILRGPACNRRAVREAVVSLPRLSRTAS